MEKRKPGRPAVFKKQYVKTIDHKEIRALKNQGRTNAEIAQLVRCSVSRVWCSLNMKR